jgi:hypothetical protein
MFFMALATDPIFSENLGLTNMIETESRFILVPEIEAESVARCLREACPIHSTRDITLTIQPFCLIFNTINSVEG